MYADVLLKEIQLNGLLLVVKTGYIVYLSCVLSRIVIEHCFMNCSTINI